MVRDRILEIIGLNKKIQLGHEDNSISYKNYSETVKPTIEEFKKTNGETPNKYLKQFLEPIYSSLPSGYQLTNFQYYGNNKLHEHVWACIYFKYPEIKSLYASSSPQLYVLVHSKGIKFGLDYGAQVENDDLLVSQVRESNELQDLIIEVTKSIDAFKLEQGAHYLAQKSDKVSLNTREAVRLTWDNSVHIINQFESDNVPINIEEEISITLTTLKPLFVKLCGIKSTIKIEQEINQEGQDKNFNSNVFFEHLESSGLQFSKLLSNRFIASMITKPLVIFTGLSGAGKTKLAQAFVQWICQDESQYRIVPVGADWTNREPLLGYPNALKPDEYVKPDNGVLDLVIDANKHSEKPYFLILDEMNLSHVERYFADFLSVMESNKGIPMQTENKHDNGVPANLNLPSNFFIIGTVNIDETTNMFSPKVLDRANTIEFRVTQSDMEKFLDNIKDIDMTVLDTKGAGMARSFLEMAENKNFDTNVSEEIQETLLHFFAELKKYGAEFGYRSATEILRLINQLTVLDDSLSMDDKLDIAIIQKLLPKLHGSRRKLVPVLEVLGSFCIAGNNDIVKNVFTANDFDYNGEGVRYPLSLEKIARMYRGALDNGFTSFAEA